MRHVHGHRSQTLAEFLEKFRRAAHNMKPGEELKVTLLREVEWLRALCAEPFAHWITNLFWIAPPFRPDNLQFAAANLPQLRSLSVHLDEPEMVDFTTLALELRPSIKTLWISRCEKNDMTKLFTALGSSQVETLCLDGKFDAQFFRGIHSYLAGDHLTILRLSGHGMDKPTGLFAAIADCTKLRELDLGLLSLGRKMALPASLTKLGLTHCAFKGCEEWCVPDLKLLVLGDVEVKQLGRARFRAAEIYFGNCDFAGATLDLTQADRLEFENPFLDDGAVALIADAVRGGTLKELDIHYAPTFNNAVWAGLFHALRHVDCALTTLALMRVHRVTVDEFHGRRAVLALLQGQQVRRALVNPLRRLPIEMLRLVGQMLI